MVAAHRGAADHAHGQGARRIAGVASCAQEPGSGASCSSGAQAAIDTELGVLKTGKEADAFLLERAVPGSDAVGESVVLVSKRYRGEEQRSFHRSAAYTAGRAVRNTRDNRAMAKKSA